MEEAMRRNQSTLSCKGVCCFAVKILVGALGVLGSIGSGAVTPLLLVEVLVRASAERRSLDAIARLAKTAPSVETIRKALLRWLPATAAKLEPVITEALHRRLPKALGRRSRTMAIDFHNKPYYGDKNTPGTIRGQRKASTKTFFAYATLMVIRKGLTFTVGLMPVVKDQEMTTIIDSLLRQAALKGLKPRRLLLDRGFYAAKVMLHLEECGIPYVIPMIRRGKSGKTAEECTATAQFFVKGREGWTTYEWQARIRKNGRRTGYTKVKTQVCMAPAPREGAGPLVFACHGMNNMAPKEVAELYRRRFRIETSYRQMHEGLALTCSKNPVYRLLLVLIALVLRNLWLWLHWTLFSERGETKHRILRLELMRARRMLHSIIRYLDKKLAIPGAIDIPSPAASAV
jgi:Transposase DDE domain